jgi:hypothetical protein
MGRRSTWAADGIANLAEVLVHWAHGSMSQSLRRLRGNPLSSPLQAIVSDLEFRGDPFARPQSGSSRK